MNKPICIGYKLLVSFLLLMSIDGYSKPVDTLIFTSDFEKSIFLDYINSKKFDPINFLISPNYSVGSESVRTSLNNLFKSLDDSGIKLLNKKKQVKAIYKKVSNEYLKKYSEESVFSDIFANESYNNISASALYALIFDHYNIEYSIKRTIVHIYLIADPNGEKINIEVSNPTSGLAVFDDKMKKSFVDYLKNNNLISDYDYKKNTVDRLFEVFYNKASTINLVQLTALQYYNWGVMQFKSFVYSEALRNLEKAEIINPDESTKILKNLSLYNLINEEPSSNKYSGKNLAKFLNENYKNFLSLSFVKEYFKAITIELTVNHPNITAYEKYYTDFKAYLIDSAANSEIDQNYYFYSGCYYYLVLNDTQKSMYYLDISHKINPEHIYTQKAIAELVDKIITPKNENYDTETMVDSLKQFLTKYTFLKRDQKFVYELIDLYKYTVFSYIEIGQFKKANQLLDELDLFIKSLSLNDNVDNFICVIYSQVSGYFSSLKLFDLSINYLKSGLEKYPNSNVLSTALNEIYEVSPKYKNSKKGCLGLDPESYSVLRIMADNRRNTINLNVDKFLNKFCWKMELYTFENQIRTFPIKEQVTLKFDASNDVKIKTAKGSINGRFVYNKKNNTLEVKNNKDSLMLRLLVCDIDSTMLKTVRYSVENDIKILTMFKKVNSLK